MLPPGLEGRAGPVADGRHRARAGEARKSEAGPAQIEQRKDEEIRLEAQIVGQRRREHAANRLLEPLFCHQCDRPIDSIDTSPALWSIGTAQALACSAIAPETT